MTFGLTEEARKDKKEGGKKKWREAKKRERAANYFAKEANEQEAKIEN